MPKRRDLEELLSLLREQMPELRERYGVRSLAVFGSVARGSAEESSDLDLLIRFESDPPGLLGFLELEGHLSTLLDAQVDLVMESALKPSLRDRILAEAMAAWLETVGEAAKVVPSEVRDRAPEIPWRVMAGMRDKLIHAYAGVDLQVVWRTVHEELPAVLAQIEALLGELEAS